MHTAPTVQTACRQIYQGVYPQIIQGEHTWGVPFSMFSQLHRSGLARLTVAVYHGQEHNACEARIFRASLVGWIGAVYEMIR